MIIVVQFAINQAIDGANGFHNTHQIKQFESAKFSIDQVSSITKKLSLVSILDFSFLSFRFSSQPF